MPSGQPSGMAGAAGCTHPLGPASWDADAAESQADLLRLAPAVFSSPPQDAEIRGNCKQVIICEARRSRLTFLETPLCYTCDSQAWQVLRAAHIITSQLPGVQMLLSHQQSRLK